MPSDRIVAVGLLTQQDVAVLGQGFGRMFPAAEDTKFDDLLKQLEGIVDVPAGSCVGRS